MFRFVPSGRRLTRALLVPAAGFAVLAGVLPASASVTPAVHSPFSLPGGRALSAALQHASPATSTPTVTLGDDAADVKLANGQTWLLDIGDDNSADSLVVALYKGDDTSAEEHIWGFDTPASSLTYSKTTGDATIKGGSATGKVATVDVSFKATSHKAAACTTGSETIYTGTMSGEAILTTGLSKAGTVGGKSVTFNEGGFVPTLTVDNSCVLKTTENDCASTSLWGLSIQSTSLTVAGLTETIGGKSAAVVVVEHDVKLSAPKGATRIDLADVETPAPSWNASSHVLSFSTTSSGLITGSATLSGGKPSTTTDKCTWQGKTYTDKNTQNFTANWSSPSGKAITAHTALTGNLALPASAKNADYFVTVES